MTAAVSRRAFVVGAGGSAAVALAGCLGSPSNGPTHDTVRVATYKAFVDAPSTSAGDYVKTQFEKQTDYKLEWVVRQNGVNDFIQRRKQGAPLEADAYLGLNPQDLVRADEQLGSDNPLFSGFQTNAIQNAGNIETVYQFDPQRRVLPTGASYVALVYDATAVGEPKTFDALTTTAFSNQLLLANPQSTTTGLLFLLWTVNTLGADNYLDYWKTLMSNGVHVLGSWSSAYSAYQKGEGAIVVSYSTDQVYAANENQDMQKHQIAFPNDQGYAYVEGLGKFATTDRAPLVQRFADFVLSPDVQQQIAVKNVGLPTVSNASLPKQFQQYAHVPKQPIQLSFDTLKAHMSDWRDAWAKQVAKK